MLVLKRKEGQWIEITHKSGDFLRFRVYDICGDAPGRANLAFDDPARNFEIQRPERPLHRDGAHPAPGPRPVESGLREG
jgi:hypothetical protein